MNASNFHIASDGFGEIAAELAATEDIDEENILDMWVISVALTV